MDIPIQAFGTGARPEDTLPTVNPRGGRTAAVVGQAQGMTHPGKVRGANEDHFLIADLERTVRLRQTSVPTNRSSPVVCDLEGTLLMVADGMGGHGNGELAAAVTLDTVLAYASSVMPWANARDEEEERTILSGFAAAAACCQERLMEVATRKGASREMGTTLTVAYVRWPDVYIAHVGDSRCYVWREGQLVQLTRDHTLGQQLRERGAGSDLAHFDHVLVNAVGGSSARPEVEGHRIRLANGDRLLLCTDGLSGDLSSPVIASLLAGSRSAGEACHALVSGALDAGGRDNVTAIVAFF